MATEINVIQRTIMASELAETGALQAMPEAWQKALFDEPMATWPKELMEQVRDYLPRQDK